MVKSLPPLLAIGILFAVALGCFGGVPGGDPGQGPVEHPAPPGAMTYGDPRLDAAVEGAVREQQEREALVEALKQGDGGADRKAVDDAWHATFGTR